MKNPNILLIVADQYRYDCIGFSNSRYPVKTPNIDKLCEKGVFFENAFTPCPVCAPARQALLSGINPNSFGALWNNDFIKTITLKPSNYYTEQLRDIDYNTALFGKWNSSITNSPYDMGYNIHKSWSDYDAALKENSLSQSTENGWFGCKNKIPLEFAQSHWMANEAAKCIEDFENKNNPWHIRIDFTDPHLPTRPSEPFASMFDKNDTIPWEGFGDNFENKPYIQKQQLVNWGIENRTWEDWAEGVALYYGTIAQLDDAVGAIINSVKDRENTIIIFTTDHGDMIGSHGMMDKHYILYDDVTHVPFIISWQGKIDGGKRIKSFVSNCLDISPTIRDIIGLEHCTTEHGQSLLPLLEKDNGRKFITSSSNGQQFGLFTQRMIRTEGFKYIWNLTDTDELYNLKKDKGELENELNNKAYAEILSDLRQKLWNELKDQGDPFIGGWTEGQLLKGRKV